jgi:hypothetical protein
LNAEKVDAVLLAVDRWAGRPDLDRILSALRDREAGKS